MPTALEYVTKGTKLMKIGWVDYSSEERKKITEILEAIREHEALDELGIGVIRDAFANILFPGISTLQTRAKYFLLVPYLFIDAERSGKTSPADVRKWVNDQEDKLVRTLMENSPGENGIIGSMAIKQHRTVRQKPSAIYWSGLRTLGIVRAPGSISLSDACRWIAVQNRDRKSVALKTETMEDGPDDADALRGGGVVFTPPPTHKEIAKDDEVSIRLSREEAMYLLERITKSPGMKDTLLAHLAQSHILPSDFWEIAAHPLPPEIWRDYHLARDFSSFLYGAQLRYNCVYFESIPSEKGRFESEYADWLSQEYEAIDLSAILRRANCSEIDPTAVFLREYARLLGEGNREVEIDELIIRRERQIKFSRAKLKKPINPERAPSPVSYYHHIYRYGTALVILKDIFAGLEIQNG